MSRAEEGTTSRAWMSVRTWFKGGWKGGSTNLGNHLPYTKSQTQGSAEFWRMKYALWTDHVSICPFPYKQIGELTLKPHKPTNKSPY